MLWCVAILPLLFEHNVNICEPVLQFVVRAQGIANENRVSPLDDFFLIFLHECNYVWILRT